MTKYLIALLVVLGAGGLFIYSQSANVPVSTEAVEQGQPTEQNPFGEGASVVGALDDDSLDDEDDEKSGGSGTVTPAPAPAPDGTETDGMSGKVISRTELAQHKAQSDCWVAYKGTVYDITSWLPRHPGSAAAIAPYCGTAEEFTAAFNKQHGTRRDERLKKEGVVEGSFQP